jgi:hypothetical protein
MRVKSDEFNGRAFEQEISGYHIERARRLFGHRCGHGVEFKHLVRRVKECQHCLGWNPRAPWTPLARSLFDGVACRLGERNPELRLFMAIGSGLDYQGIDCWFERSGRMATIDVTVKPAKPHPRANVVITRDDFIRDRHYAFGELIAQFLR